MHHTLHFYGQNQHRLIHLYLDLARLTKKPVLGTLVRWLANMYARLGHSGYLLKLEEAEQIVEASDNVYLGPCSCRQEFKNCDYPVMSEIVLDKGAGKVYSDRTAEFKKISKSEARQVLRQAEEKHLTQSIMRCGNHFYAVCNCCRCCCVPTRLKKEFGIGLALVRDDHIVERFKHHKLH